MSSPRTVCVCVCGGADWGNSELATLCTHRHIEGSQTYSLSKPEEKKGGGEREEEEEYHNTERRGGGGAFLEDGQSRRANRRDSGLLLHLSVTSSLEMEIPLEQHQILTLTMCTNMSSRHGPYSASGDECLTTVPPLPRPPLSRPLTLLQSTESPGPLSSLPARHHLTAVFKSRCQRSWCALWPGLSVYTFASMILVFATSSGVVTNAATAPTKRHAHTFSKHERTQLSEESLNLKRN